MSAKKMKELQERLDAREKELAGALARAEELEKRVNEYQSRETAIVDALAQAQESARRIVRDAETQRGELVSAAEARLSEAAEEASRRIAEAQQDAERIVSEAAAEGEGIVSLARTDAENLRLGAEAQVEKCRAQLASLRRELAEAAQNAVRQTERFKTYLGQVEIAPDADGAQDGGAEREAPAADAAAEMPEDYSTPSELMRSIYRMQGRDIPEGAGQEEKRGDGQGPAITWGWHMPQDGGNEEAPREDTDPDGQPENEEQPEPDKEAEQPAEERVWTVDEIIEGELSSGEGGADEAAGLDEKEAIDLDALINDVINPD